MKDVNFTPTGTCAKSIRFRIDDLDRIWDIWFEGGCRGCQTAIALLADGAIASKVALILHGVSCPGKTTSCPDQLSRAIMESFFDAPKGTAEADDEEEDDD